MTKEKKTPEQRARLQEVLEAIYLFFVAIVTIEY